MSQCQIRVMCKHCVPIHTVDKQINNCLIFLLVFYDEDDGEKINCQETTLAFDADKIELHGETKCSRILPRRQYNIVRRPLRLPVCVVVNVAKCLF